MLDQEVVGGVEKGHMSQTLSNNKTARYHLVKNYVQKGFSVVEIAEVTNLPVDIVKYELEKLEKDTSERYQYNRMKSLEGKNTRGGFGYYCVSR